VDLSPNFSISCTFNVEDLVPYKGTFDTLLIHSWMSLPKTFLRAPLPPLPPKLSYAAENINSILDDQIVSTRDKGTGHYLIKWKEKLRKFLGY